MEKFTFKLFLAKQSLGFKTQTSNQIVGKYYDWSNRSISSSRHPFIGSLCPINLILLFDLDRNCVSQLMQWRSPPAASAPQLPPVPVLHPGDGNAAGAVLYCCTAYWAAWPGSHFPRPSRSHQHRLSAQQNTAYGQKGK